MTQILIRTEPVTPQAGEPFKLQLLLRHPMETGLRRDASGELIPEDYVEVLELSLDETLLATLRPTGGVSANPLIVMILTLQQGGTLRVAYRTSTGEMGEVNHELRLA